MRNVISKILCLSLKNAFCFLFLLCVSIVNASAQQKFSLSLVGENFTENASLLNPVLGLKAKDDPSQFEGSFRASEKLLQSKGYKTNVLKSEQVTKAALLQELEKIDKVGRPNDQILISILEHGLPYKDMSSKSGHVVNLKKEFGYLAWNDQQIKKILKRITDKGIRVGVVDNSCFGGGTVNDLKDLNVCVIATQAATVPAINLGMQHALMKVLNEPEKCGVTSEKTLEDVFLTAISSAPEDPMNYLDFQAMTGFDNTVGDAFMSQLKSAGQSFKDASTQTQLMESMKLNLKSSFVRLLSVFKSHHLKMKTAQQEKLSCQFNDELKSINDKNLANLSSNSNFSKITPLVEGSCYVDKILSLTVPARQPLRYNHEELNRQIDELEKSIRVALPCEVIDTDVEEKKLRNIVTSNFEYLLQLRQVYALTEKMKKSANLDFFNIIFSAYVARRSDQKCRSDQIKKMGYEGFDQWQFLAAKKLYENESAVWDPILDQLSKDNGGYVAGALKESAPNALKGSYFEMTKDDYEKMNQLKKKLIIDYLVKRKVHSPCADFKL